MSAALQFKGTPGQWRAVEENFGGEWTIRGEPNGEWIDGKPVDQSPVIAEIVRNKADAHLLAMAPELLEALVDAAGLINRMWVWERDAAAEVKPTLELINTINAAIAKALKP